MASIDPETLVVTQLLIREDNDAFAHSSAAAQIGNELWISSARGDRIAIIPLPE